MLVALTEVTLVRAALVVLVPRAQPRGGAVREGDGVLVGGADLQRQRVRQLREDGEPAGAVDLALLRRPDLVPRAVEDLRCEGVPVAVAVLVALVLDHVGRACGFGLGAGVS